MQKRFVSIWFRHLATDWFSIRRPELRQSSFVLRAPVHGRMLITAANTMAQTNGIDTGMVLADARAIIPGLEVLDDSPGLSNQLLKRLAQGCIRYTPITAVDPPDGLILDVTGCAHLWGSDKDYLTAIITRLKTAGYGVRAAMADTIGAAWASARFARRSAVIDSGQHMEALLSLPAAALRIETDTEERLQKLGLRQIRDFMGMPRPALRRRFGPHLLLRLDQALGLEEEAIIPEQPVVPYQERLPCLEPIVTATGIEIALQRLLEVLCRRLQQEQKGLRMASFRGYRVDGKMEEIRIGTNRPSHHVTHLFKLFEIKLSTMEPALGIELFILEAPKVEDLSPVQEKLWEGISGLEDNRLSELMDRLSGKLGAHTIHRYIPNEHHWPERSLKQAASLQQRSVTAWRIDKPRPLQLLAKPEPIEVAAPVPDYPPMLFRYKGKLHNIKKADGPERIEREWWLEEGEHRDYYCVEDEEGHRYWVFRSGHYGEDKTWQWFLYGFFA
ncbi:MAG: Y-family DNA polymerase [Chitinophagales bacterium]